MRLKSFTARTLPDAMKQVRDALGANAIILSTQPGENGHGVRVTAALEDTPIDDLEDAAAGGVSALDRVSDALTYHRLPPHLFDRLNGAALTVASKDPVSVMAEALDAEFAFNPLPPAETPRPVLLIGPAGAGKTAMAAKLCARARLAGRPAALVTLDTDKSGGIAQAQAFAKALTARLVPAAGTGELAEALAILPPGHFTVIDTVGANPFSPPDIEHVCKIAAASRADPILVLPAGGDVADAAEAAHAFAATGAGAIIVTKLDAARRLGGLLAAARAGRMGLMAGSASPHIADPMQPFSPAVLAQLLIPGAGDGDHTDQIRTSAP